MAIDLARLLRLPPLFAVVLAGILPLCAHAANLTVTVDGLRNANGTVRIELDGSEAAWNDKIGRAHV